MKKKKDKRPLSERKADPKSNYWDNKAEWAWKLAAKERDNFTCIVGGDCQGNLEVHHLITRRHKETKWDLRNAVCLCSKHHKWDTECSAHEGQVGFSAFMLENRSEQWEWAVQNRFKVNEKNIDYEEDYNRLMEQLEELRSVPENFFT